MSELQAVCDALTAIDGDVLRMARVLHAKSQHFRRAAAGAEACVKYAEGAEVIRLIQIATAFHRAAAHCDGAARFLNNAAREGQRYVQWAVGGNGTADGFESGVSLTSADQAESAVPPSISPGAQVLADNGLEYIPLNTVDYSDNPITDNWDKEGMTRADYRWALQTWETVIWPGIAAGATRDDFARMDEACDAPAYRRTAHIYDWFLNPGDVIAYSRRPDGTLNPLSGRHRIEMARELGITYLPAMFA